MPETGCSLLLSLRAVEYRLFGVVQDAFCFEGMLFRPQNHPCYEVTIVKRRLQEIFVSGKPHLYFSDSIWKEL